MRDNVFGKLLKIAALLWTALCSFSCFTGIGAVAEMSAADELDRAAQGLGAAIGGGTVFCLWFVPMLGVALLYFLLGRSEVRRQEA